MMQVDGAPNVRVCAEPAREGAVVEPQNVIGSLDRDLVSVVDKIGRPFTPVGFYYRTLIRPRRLWPVYEKVLRNLAGLGRVDKHGRRTTRYDAEHRRVDVLVVGGGRSGLAAARAAAAGAASSVLLVDENVRRFGDEPFEVVAPGRALGVYEGGLVPVEAGRPPAARAREADRRRDRRGRAAARLPRERPRRRDAPRRRRVRLIRDFALKPGERAVVIAADDRGLARRRRARAPRASTSSRRVDLREREPRPHRGRGHAAACSTAVTIDGTRHECDLLVASGTPQPAYSLLAQAGRARRVRRRRAASSSRRDLPAGVEAAGRVTGELGAVAPTRARHGEDGFVCVCEDVGVKDMKRAIAEGFDSIELAKRYTTVTMGPCQGRYCHLSSIRLYATRAGHRRGGDRHDDRAAAVGAGVARPARRPAARGRRSSPRSTTATRRRAPR